MAAGARSHLLLGGLVGKGLGSIKANSLVCNLIIPICVIEFGVLSTLLSCNSNLACVCVLRVRVWDVHAMTLVPSCFPHSLLSPFLS